MSAAPIIDRLVRVTQHGSDRWRAICPAHECRRRTQSLSIRELPDGTVLLKCFAGCGAADVVAAVGLRLSDLFPADHRAPGQPRHSQRPGHWHALKQAVQAMPEECLVVVIAASDVAAGIILTPADAERVAVAAGRIRQAIEACR